jgi:hypothetical protein
VSGTSDEFGVSEVVERTDRLVCPACRCELGEGAVCLVCGARTDRAALREQRGYRVAAGRALLVMLLACAANGACLWYVSLIDTEAMWAAMLTGYNLAALAVRVVLMAALAGSALRAGSIARDRRGVIEGAAWALLCVDAPVWAVIALW